MTTIAKIHAREILDSRGNPTLEAEVTLADGSFGRAMVPSGASTGSQGSGRTARRRQDALPRQGRAQGRRQRQRARSPTRCRVSTRDQAALDRRLIDLDGTENKGRLGANALLGVSLANAHAVAASRKMPLWQHLAGDRAPRAAGADDEHHQRRRACRQQRRPAGIHGAAGRLRFVRRSAARRHGNLPRAEVGAERPRPEHGGRRRRRLRAGPAFATRKRSRRSSKRSARPATRPAKTCCSASTSPPANSSRTASTTSPAKASA